MAFKLVYIGSMQYIHTVHGMQSPTHAVVPLKVRSLLLPGFQDPYKPVLLQLTDSVVSPTTSRFDPQLGELKLKAIMHALINT
jgi:hypothetical protein